MLAKKQADGTEFSFLRLQANSSGTVSAAQPHAKANSKPKGERRAWGCPIAGVRSESVPSAPAPSLSSGRPPYLMKLAENRN